MERNFDGYSFERVGTICPDRDGGGALIEERPPLPRDAPLHRYGKGPFCRFRIAQSERWQRSGVYILTCGDAVRYIGQCKSLAKILYQVGSIPPSAVGAKGQPTHCRINSSILNEAKRGVEVVLWFHAGEDNELRGALKSRLVKTLNPPWTLTLPSPPRPSAPKARETPQAQPDHVAAARPSRKEDGTVAMERRFLGLAFSYAGPIRPERDERSEVIGKLPQSKFHNTQNLQLHNYGEGSFCGFQAALGWKWGGVYVLMNGDNPLYVGECQELEKRWGAAGYGRIYPRACFKSGQETNCRINNLIYKGAKTGAEFDLWFRCVKGDKQARLAVERKLVEALRPPWNR